MKYLVCNAGSTSLKFKLFEMPEQTVLSTGKVERVRSRDNAIFHFGNTMTGFSVKLEGQDIPDYTAGVQKYFSYLLDPTNGVIKNLEEIECVSFKTVLAKDFYGVHEITPEVIRGMETMLPVAPAHNIPYLEVIRVMQKEAPKAKLVGAFETAFHRDIPLARRLYAAPYEWYEKYGLMRNGAHGASHRYVSETVAQLRGGNTGKLISCHLGGSCSLCAVDDGKSVDTSFGFSLQTGGVFHAERVGDFDAFAIPYLMQQGLELNEILDTLCKNGGLKGISGVSGDLRFVEEAAEAGNERAQLAVDMFVENMVRTMGAFYAELGGLDAIAFAGGIGENSVTVRERVCKAIKHFGVKLDEDANKVNAQIITKNGSPVTVFIIPTDEESIVSKQAYECLNGK